MESLRTADLRAVLTLVDDAWAAAGDRPFTRETMALLAGLIPCDFAGYSELDRVACAVIDDAASGEPAGSEEQFWNIVEELPTCQHELAYLDFSATRLSDVISRRRLVATLTPREEEVLELVAVGFTNAGIAERLWISPGTVKKHLENVYAKLGVTNRTAAAAYAEKRRRSSVF